MTEKIEKPFLRGHFHQAGFFLALGACLMLVFQSTDARALVSSLVYSISLCGMFGVSSLYHRANWSEKSRRWMRRLDHAAIFILIAGTATPICVFALPSEAVFEALGLIWGMACMGLLQTLFWVKAPKWIAAIFYVVMGWMIVPYLPQFILLLGWGKVSLILAGGILYTVGALVYALKFPNPSPKKFGYHEVFHVLVMIAAVLHFIVIRKLIV
jgi:hemolysin III